MRLDLFLKASRLIPRRTLAQEFCDKGLIKVNGQKAKSSKEIRAGDEIEIKRRDRLTRLRVAAVPEKKPEKKQVSREQAAALFEVTGEETFGDDILSIKR